MTRGQRERKPNPRLLRKYHDVIATAEDAGWTLTVTGKGYLVLNPPAGSIDPRTERPKFPVHLPQTPSDRRSEKNALARLARQGVDV